MIKRTMRLGNDACQGMNEIFSETIQLGSGNLLINTNDKTRYEIDKRNSAVTRVL